MPYEFRRETPVVLFSLNPQPAAGRRKYLLWPVYAYRVLAPRVQNRPLNIIQKAVLGLSRAAVLQPEEKATILHLDRDLVLLVESELRSDGCINNHGLLTDRGERMLSAEVDLEDQQTASGYVFQDPWTGKLWPRFVDHLDFADTEPGENGFPVLIHGSKGRPYREQAYCVMPGLSTAYSAPTAEAILWAAQRHWRALRHLDFGEVDGPAATQRAWTHPVRPGRVALIENEPVELFLATFAYVPKQGEEDYEGSWYVCDPMGLGASEWLRQQIQQQARRDPQLDRVLTSLLPETNRVEVTESLKLIEARAIEAVNARLPERIWSFQICEALVEMEQQHQLALSAGDRASVQKLKTVMVSAAVVLEELFLFIREAFPTVGAWCAVQVRDAVLRGEILRDIAQQVGFEAHLPAVYTRQGVQRIAAAAEDGFGTLAAHVVAALLAARQETEHPLRHAAQSAPDLLTRIGQLAELRGSSAHYTTRTLSLAELDAHVDTVYLAIRLLLSLT